MEQSGFAAAASSGNMLADRRLEIARQLEARGDWGAAADLCRQALEIVPDWAAGWFTLGELLLKGGDQTGAGEAFRKTLSFDTADRQGAVLKLALLGQEPRPDRMPDAYVRALFDQYAPRFEEALVGRLAYRAPWLMREAIDTFQPALAAKDAIIDLGCGTGLAGEVFRDRAAYIDGIDLSPGMVAEAAKKDIYRTLETHEIRHWLMTGRGGYSLALAADVLIYLGALDDIMSGVRRVLVPGGLFCFTVQKNGEDEDFRLGTDHRYSYNAAYLTACADNAGFVVLQMTQCVLRKDEGCDVAGYLCVLKNGDAQ